jgi:hypothetical protein
MNKRWLAIAAAAALYLLIAIPAHADFAEVVKCVESKAGSHKTPVPFFGLVRAAVWMIHPEGVHDVELATWEDTDAAIDGREITKTLQAKAGASYQPIIRSRSRNGEWAYIYARPRGTLMEIVIVTHDKSDTVAMRAVIELKRLELMINDHRHATDVAMK